MRRNQSGHDVCCLVGNRRGERRAAHGGLEGRRMNRTLDGDIHYSNGDLEISQCVWCRHRSSDGRRCRAYPDGIPDAILMNRHDHRSPYKGDSGLRFEPRGTHRLKGIDGEWPLFAASA